MITMPDGRKKDISGTPAINTKAAAEGAERAHIHRLMHPQLPKPAPPKRKEGLTLCEFAPTYLATKRTKSHSYYETIESILDASIIPAFGPLLLGEIEFAHIQDYTQAKLARPGTRGLSPKSVCNHLSVIRQILVLGKKRGLLEEIPEIEWPQSEESKFDFLSFEEAKALILSADPGQWQSMMTVALNTGMRMGELRGLHWKHVNFDDRSLRVTKSYVRGRMKSPKSRTSRRVIGLNDVAFDALKAHRHLCGPLVFPQDDGSPITKGRMRWPLWRACDRAGIGRRIGWHVLRHSFASHLVMKGVHLIAVQELLGHSTIKMTERYAHLSPEVKREAVQLLCE